MSMGKKLKLWLKYGFRHRYPTEVLGPAPPPPGRAGVEAPKTVDQASLADQRKGTEAA
jgi:hypothetical protein